MGNKFALYGLMVWLTVFLFSPVFAWPVPDTGQTKCYDDTGEIMPCPTPGQPFHGQDGNFTINPPCYIPSSIQKATTSTHQPPPGPW
ncbi:hypothetical protein GW871_11865 [bacterium]|nr:hypothetical protein [bacterium]